MESFYKVRNKKESVKTWKTSNNRSRVFDIALEGGEGGNESFASESFDHSMLLLCLRQHSVNIDYSNLHDLCIHKA